MPKAGKERSREMGEARDSLGVFLNDPSNQPKRASSVNIEDLDSEAGQAQKRMKKNGQEGGDSSGKDSSGSSSRSQWSRQKRSGIHQYVRPPRPRVYCHQCTKCPNGFRSDHELRRHTEREHALTPKVWVIKDISEDKKFLSKCKACMSGKRYRFGYYNAAAHLRRCHFSERKMHQQGGGDKEQPPPVKAVKPPSMEELRSWIEEVEVTAETPPSESPEPPEGESAQQDSATASKEAAGDPTHSGGQDDIALANRPASEHFFELQAELLSGRGRGLWHI